MTVLAALRIYAVEPIRYTLFGVLVEQQGSRWLGGWTRYVVLDDLNCNDPRLSFPTLYALWQRSSLPLLSCGVKVESRSQLKICV